MTHQRVWLGPKRIPAFATLHVCSGTLNGTYGPARMQSSNKGGIAVRCLGEHHETMSVFSSQNVTGSNAQTNLDTLYTGWTRLPHMLVPSCDLQQAHTVTCPRVDMQRGHRRHLPDLSIPRLHICGIWTIFT